MKVKILIKFYYPAEAPTQLISRGGKCCVCAWNWVQRHKTTRVLCSFLWLAWNKFQQKQEKKTKQSWKQWRRVKRKSEIFCVSFGCSPPEKKSYCVYIFILSLHSCAAIHNQKLMQSHRRIKTDDDDGRERKVYKTFFADFWDYLKKFYYLQLYCSSFPRQQSRFSQHSLRFLFDTIIDSRRSSKIAMISTMSKQLTLQKRAATALDCFTLPGWCWWRRGDWSEMYVAARTHHAVVFISYSLDSRRMWDEIRQRRARTNFYEI